MLSNFRSLWTQPIECIYSHKVTNCIPIYNYVLKEKELGYLLSTSDNVAPNLSRTIPGLFKNLPNYTNLGKCLKFF